MRYCIVILIAGMTLLNCREPKPGTAEARGVWVTRWEYTTNLDTLAAETQKAAVRALFREARDARLNFILFQVRGSADAFYRSEIEPWAAELTGTLGQDPGWDPLEFAVNAAHELGLELHAWINTFPCWRDTLPPPAAMPEHILNVHPEWVVADSGGSPMEMNGAYLSLSPGIPAVREHIKRVALDIAARYDIDGIHFDYIRYPEGAGERGYSHDRISTARFNSPEGNPHKLSWEEWQREQVTQFLRSFYRDAVKQKPHLKISAAVIGKYDWSSWNGYHAVFQDPEKWVKEKIVDFIVPMIYWDTAHPTSPFGPIIKQWTHRLYHDRYVLAGIGSYKMDNDERWLWREVRRQIALTRATKAAGMVFFSASSIMNHADSARTAGFKKPAYFPPLPWKDDMPPNTPRRFTFARPLPGIIDLFWSEPDTAQDGDTACRYALYRSLNKKVKPGYENILAIIPGAVTSYRDSTAAGGAVYYYRLSALDWNNNESKPTEMVAVPPFPAVMPGTMQEERRRFR